MHACLDKHTHPHITHTEGNVRIVIYFLPMHACIMPCNDYLLSGQCIFDTQGEIHMHVYGYICIIDLERYYIYVLMHM